MKKLLPVLILILIGCSEQDRYEMYNQSIRIDKKNGEYEYKICGKWYVSNWIESENLKKEYSYMDINFFEKDINIHFISNAYFYLD